MQWRGHAPPNSLKCFVILGCQSRVARTGRPRRSNISIMRFTRGTIASPSGTPREPPGQKSFWRSTTNSAGFRDMEVADNGLTEIEVCVRSEEHTSELQSPKDL